MRYEELVQTVANAMSCATVSKSVGHVAFQFNVEGEGEGAFYVEIADGRINVEPYEYYDRDMIVATTAETILQMVEGRLSPRVAFTNGQLRVVYGDSRQLELLPMGCGHHK